jgi:hypothetical protein
MRKLMVFGNDEEARTTLGSVALPVTFAPQTGFEAIALPLTLKLLDT